MLWNDAQNRYTIIAFVKNAFDEVAYLRSTGSRSDGGWLAPTVGLVYPQTYGLELQSVSEPNRPLSELM